MGPFFMAARCRGWRETGPHTRRRGTLRAMSKEHRRQLTVNIALLEREQDSLEAAYAKARQDIERAERTGTAADLGRANAIAESARIALARCEAQLRRLKVELAEFAGGEG